MKFLISVATMQQKCFLVEYQYVCMLQSGDKGDKLSFKLIFVN
jgi:hypothetical protein